ncbi:hypothetical protein EGN73_07405 [Arthrospiribacter ruber]|uniref:ABC transporter ATPase n=2 Tax=Arthrospiribacter ruber TaxID=2487934 RepID=A0A951IV06_9BACT|nr:hypothetical protein [Arthrospiribacter ruber]MBW3467640.1 hypothetical protein [Arthrospiribacter ruber]
MYLEFDQMPAQARIWVYQSERKFTATEKAWIEDRLRQFCVNWNTHGAMMPTSFTIKFDQVIILSVDESQLGASGCSIDSSVRTLREIEQKLGVNLLDQGKVGFLEEGDSLIVNSVFKVKESVQNGILNQDTLVLNPMVREKKDLKDNWLMSAKDTWLNKYFRN